MNSSTLTRIRPSSLLLLWGVLFLFTGIFTSGCGVLERFDRTTSAIEQLEADIDRGIAMIENDKERWRSTLQELASDIPNELQSTVRVELQQLANRSVATAGTEIRCNVDFLAHRAIQGLQRVKAILRNRDPKTLPPEICQVSPLTLDMNIERARRVDVSISGYDMDHIDNEGMPLRFVYRSDAQNKTFLFPESRVGRTTHYQITLNTSGADFDQFIYVHQINKIWGEWEGRSESPQVNLTRWEPRKKELKVPLGSFDYTPPLTHGDRDFDTDDDDETDVNLSVRTRQVGNRIEASVYMKARERDPDNTTVEGWSRWFVGYEAPAGWKIINITRLGRSDTSFVATSHQMRSSTLPQGEIADRFETWIDRSGDEAGASPAQRFFCAQ